MYVRYYEEEASTMVIVVLRDRERGARECVSVCIDVYPLRVFLGLHFDLSTPPRCLIFRTDRSSARTCSLFSCLFF